MITLPAISVVLPVYNGEKFLLEAVRSVLDQSLRELELVVVDDGSNDGTAALLRGINDTRLKILTNDGNKGIIFSLNSGIRASKAEFIARMDADDIALPDRLERQLEYLKKHEKVAVVGGQTVLIDEKGNETGKESYPVEWRSIKRSIFVHNPFPHGAVLIRRDALGSGDPYDARFLHNEDYALWLRLAASSQLANLATVVLKRRIHQSNITVQKQEELIRYRSITLKHALKTYFPNPYLRIHLLRPWLAYHYRRIRNH